MYKINFTLRPTFNVKVCTWNVCL